PPSPSRSFSIRCRQDRPAPGRAQDRPITRSRTRVLRHHIEAASSTDSRVQNLRWLPLAQPSRQPGTRRWLRESYPDRPEPLPSAHEQRRNRDSVRGFGGTGPRRRNISSPTSSSAPTPGAARYLPDQNWRPIRDASMPRQIASFRSSSSPAEYAPAGYLDPPLKRHRAEPRLLRIAPA